MKINKEKIIEILTALPEKESLKYECPNFDLGALMIDVWKKNKFYNIQIIDEYLGLSFVEEDKFNSMPDRYFEDEEEFLIAVNLMIFK